ncbi:DUF308 domain-containing protein [Lactobacillus sp.]|uniref:DUF308 domain-containing protein n=1 Tax=Lactobacillus sp. TaxID=1591 RepID=UPI00198C7FBC|nr:DUF308 domain-containing protein [Lactobacillus sp.]MBD5429775.1 hypothetical protein [Lactobacillus sp.]
MQINIWVSLIVLLVGLWDIYTAFQRKRNKKLIAEKKLNLSKAQKRNYPTGGETYFLILGIIFTVLGIILLIWH